MRIVTLTLTLLAVLSLLVGPAQAGWVTSESTSVGDTMLNSGNPDAPSGFDSDTLWLKASRPRMLVQFDMPTLPTYGSGISVEWAYAQITAGSSSFNGPLTFDAYMQTQAWAESQATWNSATTGTAWGGAAGGWGTGMVQGSNILDTQTYTSAGVKNFDITSAAQAWMNGTAPNNGLLFDMTAGSAKMPTRENATASTRPKMTAKWRVTPNEVVNYSQKDVAYLGTDGVTETHWGSAPREHVGQPSFADDMVTWLKFDIPDLASHTLKEAWLDFGGSSSAWIPEVTATSHSDDSWTTLEYSVVPDGIDIQIVAKGENLAQRKSIEITDMLTAAGEGLGESLTIKLYRTDTGGAYYADMNGGDGDYIPMTLSLVTEVPEPTTMGLLGLGGLAMLKRRRR